MHPLSGLPVARQGQERSSSRVQQRQGGHQGVAAGSVGNEVGAHERCPDLIRGELAVYTCMLPISARSSDDICDIFDQIHGQ